MMGEDVELPALEADENEVKESEGLKKEAIGTG